MATSFKDHSATEIEETIKKALEELLGAPIAVNITHISHQRPEGAAAFLTESKWSAQLDMRIAHAPPELSPL